MHVLLVLVMLALGPVPVATAGESPQAGARELNAGAPAAPLIESRFTRANFARALLAETNRVRREHRQPPLRGKKELEAAADDQAAFMALIMHVQHESFLRGQGNAAERVRRHGAWGAYISENVAYTSLGEPLEGYSVEAIAATLVDQWLKSPGHRENLLNPRLTHFGGSVRLARLLGQWGAYGVQVFSIEGSGLRS